MTSPREINPHKDDVPPGWPRPFYRLSDNIEYVQWITETPSQQIMSCNVDKTYAAGIHHLCTSCGHKMERGLLFDRDWVNSQPNRPDDWGLMNTSGKLSYYDAHYGGSICFRCAVFALKHCPFFSAFASAFGDDLQWFITTSDKDTREGDDTTVLEIIGDLPTITSGQIKSHVRNGELFLLEVDNLEELQATVRPRNEDNVRGNEDLNAWN